MTERWDFNRRSSDVVSLMTLDALTLGPDNESIRIENRFVTGASDYAKLKNLPTINGSPIVGDYLIGEGLSISDKVVSIDAGLVRRVRAASSAQWAVEPTYVPDLGQVIIYTDYVTVDGVNFAGIKVGDGETYIVDLPFVCGELRSKVEAHIADKLSHVSPEDRAYWNGKHKVSESVEDEVLEIIF